MVGFNQEEKCMFEADVPPLEKIQIYFCMHSTIKKRLVAITEQLIKFRYLNRRIVFTIDLFLSCFATLTSFAILLRLSPMIVGDTSIGILICGSVSFSAFALYFSRVYRVIIRYMSFQDVSTFFYIALSKGVAMFFLYLFELHPISLFGTLLLSTFDMGVTFFILLMFRSTLVTAYYWFTNQTAYHKKRARVLIYGSGEASSNLGNLLKMQESPLYRAVAYMEVKSKRRDLRLTKLKVLQFPHEEAFARYTRSHAIEGILFPNEDLLQAEVGRVVEWCMQREIDMFVMPHIERTYGEVKKQIREVHIEDLLGRERISIDNQAVDELLIGKRLLVSGAAGSIGSEIVRQLCKLNIKELTCYDNAETPLHNLELEIRRDYPDIDVEFILGDVRSRKRISAVFSRKRPQVVYHAAAYKHVPMIERNPCEGILVNVLGTKNMAEMSVKYGVEHFVMVSTDKAVCPTNVMGATKRLAEMFVQSFNVLPTSQNTTFITTRFGNVLGSNGSVIPLFREQIQKGGPITVTHPEITRYFMTIPEACRLVLQASTMGTGGEIFVFDMGNPVKIADLAKRMIRLAGLRVGDDIEIVYSGLRPGEKLYEELLTSSESTNQTLHGKIHRAIVSPVAYEPLEEGIQELITLSQQVDVEGSVRLVKRLVPDYVSNNSVFEKLDGEKR
ncbi:MAG: polysaccharide biosynthesis protein [Phocaeicola sp.]